MMSQDEQKIVTDKDIKDLIIARLHTLSKGRKISIGSEGEFTTEELIERVNKGDDIGKKIIEIQLQYLQSLKNGIFLSD